MDDEKNTKLAAMLKQAWEEQEKYRTADAGYLCRKEVLTGGDISRALILDTGSIPNRYEHLPAVGIRFIDWTNEELDAFPADQRPEMEDDNNHGLRFPCTPEELYYFFELHPQASKYLSGLLKSSFVEAMKDKLASKSLPRAEALMERFLWQRFSPSAPKAPISGKELQPRTQKLNQKYKAILDAIARAGCKPHQLPAHDYRKSSQKQIKQRVREDLMATEPDLFPNRATFDYSWQTMRRLKMLQDS